MNELTSQTLKHYLFPLPFFVIILLFLSTLTIKSQDKKEAIEWPDGRPDECTTITVGSKATFDGSVMTSHTDDSHRTRTWIDIVPAKTYKKNSTVTMVKRVKNDSLPMPAYKHIPVGSIPQVEKTYGFINSAYPCINEKQLAIGESTFGGREELHSEKGLIDCQQLVQLMLERCTTAREAIQLADELTTKYGWNDYGECLTIADKKEVWMFEIVGPGSGNLGSVWVAQRVPDEHISVNANASRVREIDIKNSDMFLASKNIFQVAKDSSWWKPSMGAFQFNYAYDPRGRQSFASRRREWRVLSLAAPSLGLHPEAENFPFSVKPDSVITLQKMVDFFQDYYEGTDYNFVKNITSTDKDGKTVISPMANPFMPYDMNKVFNINGGWGWRGERTIARWYTIYATIIQSRSWLPDEIGGVVWLAWDNVATSIYSPIYCNTTKLHNSSTAPGRVNGFSRESAWWAFNRLGTLTAQRWGDMRVDVTKVWSKWQTELFANQARIEKEALALHKSNPEQASKFLTNYSNKWSDKIFKKAWKLGDDLWTKYDELF